MFLTPDELKELTGFSQPRKIMAWLDSQGYRYRINGKGWPSVLRDAILNDLNGQPKQRRPQLRLA